MSIVSPVLFSCATALTSGLAWAGVSPSADSAAAQVLTHSLVAPALSWEGVFFTPQDRVRTLRLVNQLSDVELDHAIGLDARAVRAIVSARPITSIAELAEVHYVGQVALERLKHSAAKHFETAETARFIGDLQLELIDYYADHEPDIGSAGGYPLDHAIDQVSSQTVWSLSGAELASRGLDPARFKAYLHPDVVSPGSTLSWQGIYDRASGRLVHISAVALPGGAALHGAQSQL